MSFQEIDMKHKKLIAVLATAGGLFAMGTAHAIAPAAAAGLGIIAGAAVGSAAAQAANPPTVAVVPAPTVAVSPGTSTVVMGGPPVVQQVVPAPHAGYRWQQGHHEIQNGVSVWVPGQWVANEVVIYQQ
jgi:hypothetical protein